MTDLSPIILFVYNRPNHLTKTLEALARNTLAINSDLYIFSDGPKNLVEAQKINEVRLICERIQGFASVNISKSIGNKGLAESVIQGVTHVLKKHNSCIVLEDDILTSIDFLEFMNEALNAYKYQSEIISISGYNYPNQMEKIVSGDVFLACRSSSWGWATWADRWKDVDWSVSDYEDFIGNQDEISKFKRGGNDLVNMLSMQMKGKIDSWSIRFDYFHFKKNGYCLYPVKSKVDNFGFDGSGVHCGKSDNMRVNIFSNRKKKIALNHGLVFDERINEYFNRFFNNPGIKSAKRNFIYALKNLFK